MSKERELLERLVNSGVLRGYYFIAEVKELLAQTEQTEQEPVTDKPTETAMAVMPNGVCVSNVYDAYEEGRKSVMVKQEPVVWQVIGIAGFMYVYNKPRNQVYEHHTVNALYLAPPSREPLSDEQIEAAREGNTITVHAFARAIEKAHGIGVDDEH